MNVELKQFMEDHDLSYRRFARLFGVSRRTAIYWAQGEMNPPCAVLMVVRAIKADMVTIEWAQEEVERIQWGG